jgi:serine/threonine protein kinase
MGRKSEIGRASLKMTMLSEVATPYYRAPDGILNTPSSVSKKRRGSVEEDLDGKNRSRTRADEHATAKGNMAASSQPNYTAAVDMWACGCILAELLLRKPLFPGKNSSYTAKLSLLFHVHWTDANVVHIMQTKSCLK